jgi:uncharacterized Zn finger protein
MDAIERLRLVAESAIASGAGSGVAARGVTYARRGKVVSVKVTGDLVEGTVQGSAPAPYQTAIRVDTDGGLDALCTCPYEQGDWCKHIVATILHATEPIATQPTTRPARPKRSSRPTRTAATPKRCPLAKPRRRARSFPAFDAKVARREIRRIIHRLDRMRRSEAYWHVSEVTRALEAVRAEAEARFLSLDGIASAFEQLGVLTEECSHAWEALDDSDGHVGDLARDLGRTWMHWLLQPNVPPLLRRRYTNALETWHRACDDYGVGEPFEAAAEAGRFGWESDGPPDLVAVKLDLLEERGDDEAFLALAHRSGEIQRYALRLVARGDFDAAVAGFKDEEFDANDALQVAMALDEADETSRGVLFALELACRAQPIQAGRWSNSDGRGMLASWAAETAERRGDAATAVRGAETAFALDITIAQYRRIERLAGSAWPARRAELLDRARACRENEAAEAIEVFLDAGCLDDARRLAGLQPHRYPRAEIGSIRHPGGCRDLYTAEGASRL